MRLVILILAAIIVFVCRFVEIAFFLIRITTKHPQFYRESLHEITGCSILNNNNNNADDLDRTTTSFSIAIDGRVYPQQQALPLYENKSIDFECLEHLATKSRHHRRRRKNILLWTKFKGEPFPDFEALLRQDDDDFFARAKCPISNCHLTSNRTLFNESELVLFHVRNRIDFIPLRSSARQRYVQVVYESPVHCSKCSAYTDTFNLTATYTSRSDFSSLYLTQEAMYWTANGVASNGTRDVHAAKSEFAAALISNCRELSLRLKYISLVNERLLAANNASTPPKRVSVYGKCGEPCPVTGDVWSAPECRRVLAERAMFFFASENSICDDYITEKFFDTLRHDTIPVVLGGGDYAKFVPTSGFINAMAFESPAHLADYLLYLERNKTAYNAYFQWKRYVNFRDEGERVDAGFLCEMCIRLHLEDYGVVAFESKRLLDLDGIFRPGRACKKAEYVPNERNIRFVNDVNMKAETFLTDE